MQQMGLVLLPPARFGSDLAATRENRSSGFSARSETNLPVLSKKQARSLKFWIYIDEELYYICVVKNRGADQICSFCTAGLDLCFHLCMLLVFL